MSLVRQGKRVGCRALQGVEDGLVDFGVTHCVVLNVEV